MEHCLSSARSERFRLRAERRLQEDPADGFLGKAFLLGPEVLFETGSERGPFAVAQASGFGSAESMAAPTERGLPYTRNPLVGARVTQSDSGRGRPFQ